MKTFDLELLSKQTLANITLILDSFDIQYVEHTKYITMCCPIHGGDNPSACSILKTDVGNWRCFTHACHEDGGSTILNFVQKLLNCNLDPQYNLTDACNWIIDFLKIDIDAVEQKIEFNKEKTSFIHLYKHISKKPNFNTSFYPRNLGIKHIDIPSSYYIKRGYSKEILQKFDVGECFDSSRSMFGRVIVPCYDESGKFIVGYIGRSVFDKCDKCNRFHNPNDICPLSAKEKLNCVKWKMSSGFNAETYLYNIWNMVNQDHAILVEGAGDVWRLEEAGISNSLALFGTKFTQEQRLCLSSLPITKLLICTDNDNAGNKIRQSIKESCKKLFKIVDVTLPSKDIGEMSITHTQDLFRSLI